MRCRDHVIFWNISYWKAFVVYFWRKNEQTVSCSEQPRGPNIIQSSHLATSLSCKLSIHNAHAFEVSKSFFLVAKVYALLRSKKNSQALAAFPQKSACDTGCSSVVLPIRKVFHLMREYALQNHNRHSHSKCLHWGMHDGVHTQLMWWHTWDTISACESPCPQTCLPTTNPTDGIRCCRNASEEVEELHRHTWMFHATPSILCWHITQAEFCALA